MSILEDMDTISVVIPAYNAESTLPLCLGSLKEQTVQPLEILLVDDASTDDTASVARASGAELVSFKERRGPAKARNTGAEKAEGSIVLFLDSDVVPPPDLLEKIAQRFASDRAIVAVQTLYSPGCPADDMVSVYQNFYYFHALNRIKGNHTATFATWCAAVRKDSFMEIGGFNENIPEPTVEDEELGYSLVDSGRRIFLDRDIRVVHLAKYSLGQFIRRRYRMAKAQAKSGWRSVKNRLLLRYMNIRETGTHHSRWVVLSIVLVLLACLLAGVFVFSLFSGTGRGGPFLTSALLLLALSLFLNIPFFSSGVSFFGWRILPGFLALWLLDMAVLGWGITVGTVQFVLGKNY